MNYYYLKIDKDLELILNRQYSKIGYEYPRIFVRNNTDYINFDIAIKGAFFMKESDFHSIKSDSKEINYQEFEEMTSGYFIDSKLESFVNAIRGE